MASPLARIERENEATVNLETLTSEAKPVEVGPGSPIFAATIARLGSLRVRTICMGADTTFGRLVKMAEEAGAYRAEMQRITDKFLVYSRLER